MPSFWEPASYCGGVTSHYFSDADPAEASELHLLEMSARGFDLQMWVGSQVFSASKLDLGTAQLLKVAPPLPLSGRFLDLGCGWGPLAVMMGLEAPQAEVWAVDVNRRALAMSERNAQVNGAENVEFWLEKEALRALQDAAEPITFEVIWSNPPMRIGKAQTQALLKRWLEYLSPTGAAYLVCAKNLGADSLIVWLGEQGFVAQKIASKKGYRIIEVTKQ